MIFRIGKKKYRFTPPAWMEWVGCFIVCAIVEVALVAAFLHG